MQIETDQVQITSGVRHGRSLGSPIALVVENKDWKHWTKIMGSEPITEEEESEMKRQISRPRPGHADLNGAIKYGHRDMRNVLERSSARETTVGSRQELLPKGSSPSSAFKWPDMCWRLAG